MVGTDFWWLSPDERNIYTYVMLSYQKPLRDDDQPYFDHEEFHPIGYIDQWRNKFDNTNIYRSFKIWSDVSKERALRGPFILDIDNERGYLDDALEVTRNAVKHMKASYNITANDMRIFFTGHKGFNIEICPKALQIYGSIGEQMQQSEARRNEIIRGLQRENKLVPTSQRYSNTGTMTIVDAISGKKFPNGTPKVFHNQVSQKGTVVDRIHGYTRLHDSFNGWIESNRRISRKKIELAIDELEELAIREIVARSEQF